MKKDYPRTFEYFNKFRRPLEQRTLHKRWGKNNPFYSMYNIGPYTFAPFKVAWKRTTKDFGAAVLSTFDDPILGVRQVVPNGKVMIVPFSTSEEGHFLCGQINSDTARSRINSSITSEAHQSIINVVPLQRFNPNKALHTRIVELSVKLHRLAAHVDMAAMEHAESELDAVVRRLWEYD